MIAGNSSIGGNSVAIVGISCRFPKADSVHEFWSLLQNKKHTIEDIPKERWDADLHYDADPMAERKTHQREASLLKNIHDFDPLFFNISPAEAIEMSPSQKLMLELSWEAIESSTIPFRNIRGNNVSVYVGNIWSDFEHYRKFRNARPTLHSAVGMSSPVVANRVSFALGLTGPSLVVDTGCSASLVALHLACRNLISNESSLSIVGGINHILDPDKYIELTRFGGLSLKGRCSSFDAAADGFVRGEGGGVLLLKRLEDAERDGDRIYAVIRGTAVNNNGFNDTLPATSTEGQLSLLENAYAAAGIKSHEVHYVEAHGTGTRLGDPNEAKAIGEFFRKDRNRPLRIGSVKTNIGHTEATAGIAGLIKVVLAMQHHLIPANLHFNTPNPDIPFDSLKLEVQKEATSWPAIQGETYKAGVNSFGWGGTNAHAVLEQYVSHSNVHKALQVPFALPLSAKAPQPLLDYSKRYATLLEACDDDTFAAVCIATALVKTEFDHRHVFSGFTREEVLADLNTFIEENVNVTPAPSIGKHKVVFVFPGQGAQWLGMGRDLIQKEQAFREMMEACEAAFRPYTDWSLLEQLGAAPDASRLNEINVIQPMIFAMQISLAKTWQSWGLTPDAVVGHSMGEVAAAFVAGALTLDDAARIICTRSNLMRTVSGKGGAMAVTELSKDDAEQIVSRYDGRLSVAVNNSHKSTVIAGDKQSIDHVLQELEAKGLFCRLVKVDVASHSPQMDPLKEPLHAALTGVIPQEGTIRFYSTVTGGFKEGASLNADYWVNNLRSTVQFASVMNQLMTEGHTVFLECNPHPVLVNVINECAESAKADIITVSSTTREKDEHREMRRNMCELYSRGYSVDWSAYYKTSQVPHADLPLYPFQRERYEIDDLSSELTHGVRGKEAAYPMLGNRVNLAHLDHTYFWESVISLQKFPFLKDHLVNNTLRVPTSCYVELMLEAIMEIFEGNTVVRVEDVVFAQHVSLSEKDRVEIQVKLLLHGRYQGKLTIFRKEPDNGTWTMLASAGVRQLEGPYHSQTGRIFDDLDYQEPAYTEGINYYNLLRSIGFDFGRHFNHLTGIDQVNRTNAGKILFSIKPDEQVLRTAAKYRIHPALLSSFFHPLIGQLMTMLEEGNHMKVDLQRIHDFIFEGDINYHHEIRGLMIMQDMQKKADVSGTWTFRADIVIANFDNTPVMTIKGLEGTATRLIPAGLSSARDSAGPLLSRLQSTISDSAKIELLQQTITTHVARIVKMPAAKIRTTMTFKGLGLDSLMAVQLRNHVESELTVKIPVGMFWAHPTIKEYATYLLGMLSNERVDADAGVRKHNTTDSTNWFTIANPSEHALFRLFCFHDAGGSASLFDGWDNYFDLSLVELVSVELPGRGRRINEAPITDTTVLLSELVPALAPLLDKPYVFLGHSMGGLVAFEVMHELRKIHGRLPEVLFISSTSGLNAYEKRQVDYTLPNEVLVKLYPHLDLSVVKDEELQQMLIQILRADLQLLHGHQYRFEVPFNVPIVAIHGQEDQRVSRHQIGQWEKETFASFRLLSRPGGHRYIEQDGEFVAGLIRSELQQVAETKPSAEQVKNEV
jgi:acyl transferase domain-containing protein/surfactin synthase thioesterase subunit